MTRTATICWWLAALVPAIAASPLRAWELRSRFVERIGGVEYPVEDDRILIGSLEPRHVRIQFGVFDDAAGPAPAGGLLGWNAGSIHLGFGVPVGVTRTPGRLDPFTFPGGINANGNPPLPGGDPFTSLTDISATLGIQTVAWGCGDDGQPLPMPSPSVYGRNSFMSLFEITAFPRADVAVFSVLFEGDLLAVDRWLVVGNPVPPDCDDPMNPIPGEVIYAPHPLGPQPFSRTLRFIIPAPHAVVLFGAMIPMGMRRRCRHRSCVESGARPS